MSTAREFAAQLVAVLEATRSRCTVAFDGGESYCTEPGTRVKVTCNRGHVDETAFLCLGHIDSPMICPGCDAAPDCRARIVSVIAEVA